MNLIERVKNILVTPKTEWEKINSEEQTMSAVLMGYVVPLALIGTVAAFIGYGFIGINVGFGFRIKGIDWGIYEAITRFVAAIVAVVGSAFVIDMFAPTFKSEKNLNKSAQLAAYSSTASLVGGIFLLLPALGILAMLCGIYGIYLMYLGIGPLKKTPDDQKVVYMVVSIIVYAVIFGILLFLLHLILGGILGLSYNVGGLNI